ncbi:MAG: hypothetical protein ABI823_16640 [Bryobacteraceae bacterium]
MRWSFFLLAALPALAALDGTVMNLTSDKPQAGVIVSLVQPGQQGMKELAKTTSAADGKFHIDMDPPEGPALLQGSYQTVTYTFVLGPGQPHTGIVFNVYDVSKRPEIAKVTQHMVVLEPSPDKLLVNETFLVSNTSNLTLSDPFNGSLRIVLPEGAGEAKVLVQAGVVPVQRPAIETRQKGVYKVDYPVKPGETRFDVSYAMPAASTFSGRTVYKDAPTRLVSPAAVTLEGDGIVALGQEPTTQAHIYDTKGLTYTATINGVGALRPPGGDAGEDPGSAGGPEIKQIRPKLYERLYWILGLTFAILALGFVLIYRRDAPEKQDS